MKWTYCSNKLPPTTDNTPMCSDVYLVSYKSYGQEGHKTILDKPHTAYAYIYNTGVKKFWVFMWKVVPVDVYAWAKVPKPAEMQ